MAKNDKEVKLIDDFDFNDELDFNTDLEFDFTEPKDDRKPVTVLKDTLVNKTITQVSDESALRNLADKALPSGYNAVISDAFDIRHSLEKAQRDLFKDLPKEVENVRRLAGRAAPLVRRKLGDKLGGRLADYLESEAAKASQGSESPVYNAEDSEVAELISKTFGETFKVQDLQNKEQRENDLTREAIKDVRKRKEFESSYQQLTQTNNFLSQLVSYQNIDFKYKKSHLELAQRQYFTLRKILETNVDFTNKNIESLAAIIKNTALPEFRKIEMSESLQEQMRDNFVEVQTERITDFSRGYFKKMLGNVGDLAKQKNQEIKDAISMVTDMLSGVLDSAEMMGDDGQELTPEEQKQAAINQVIEMVGSLGFSKVAEKAAVSFLNTAKKSDRFMTMNQNLKYLSDNKARIIDDFIKENEYSWGAKGLLAKGLGAIAPSLNPYQEKVSNNLKDKSLEPISWTMQSHRTLNEIIPGWFSKIDHTLRVLTYGEGQEKETYDFNSERFTTVKQAGQNTLKSLVNKDTIRGTSDQADVLLNTIDPDNKLEPKARKELKKILIENANHNLGFSLKDFQDYSEVYNNTPYDLRDELIDFFTAEFNTDFNSEFQSTDVATARKKNAISSQYRRLSDTLPNIQDMLNDVNRLGTKDQLRQLGILTGDENDTFNYSEYYRLLQGGELGYLDNPEQQRLTDFKPRTNTPNAPNGYTNQLSNVTVIEGSDEQQIPIWVRLAQESVNELQQEKKTSDKHEEFLTNVVTYLTEIKELLATQVVTTTAVNNNDETSKKSISSLLPSVGKHLKTVGSGSISLMKSGLLKSWSLGGKLASLPLTTVRGGMSLLGKLQTPEVFNDIKDKYGNLLLSAKEFKLRPYFDAVSGKRITKPEEIRGAVLDSDGNTVISEEQYQNGLVTKDKNSSRLISIGKKIIGAQLTIPKVLLSGTSKALTFGKEGISKGISKLTKATDIYIGGEAKPRLLKIIMDNGGYFDAASGLPIKSLKDIKGDVIDASGNLVVTLSELTEGIFDKYGNKINVSGLWTTLKNTITSIVKTPFTLIGKMGRGIKESVNTQIAKSLLMKLPDNVILQTKNVTMIEDKPSVFGDKDGDGVRDGSWQDYLGRDKNNNKENNTSKDKPSNTSSKGLLGGLLGSLMEGLGNFKDTLSDTLGSVSDMLGGDGLSKGSKPSKGPKKGLLNKAGSAVKKAGSFIGRNVGKIAVTAASFGWGALTTIGSWAAAAGSAVLGFISTPIVLGAAAVMAIGYVGYKGYTYFNSRRGIKPLEQLRYYQYGVDTSIENVLVTTREFEDSLLDEIKPMGQGIDIPLSAEDLFDEYGEDFGCDLNDLNQKQEWSYWYNYRFKPSFLTWAAATSGYKDEDGDPIGFFEIDDKLPQEKKYEFAKLTIADGRGGHDPYSVVQTPFPKIPLIANRKVIIDYLENVIKTTDIKTPEGKDKSLSKQTTVTKETKSATSTKTSTVKTLESYTKAPNVGTYSYTGRTMTVSKVTNEQQIKKLTEIEKVRYYQYGADIKNQQQVMGLVYMERYLFDKVSISREGKVKTSFDFNNLLAYIGPYFKLNSDSENDRLFFKGWFENRFMPIYGRFIKLLKEKKYSLETYQDKLTPQDQLAFLYSQIANRLDTPDGHVPFEVDISPWKGHTVPTDINDLQDFVEKQSDILQQRGRISDKEEEEIKKNRVQVFSERAKKSQRTGGMGKSGLPTLNQFNRSTSEYYKNLPPVDYGQYKTQEIELTKDKGDGKVVDHKITDKVEERIAKYDDIIARAAAKYGVDQHLIRAVIRQESAGNPNAVSPVGAMGLMQFMPATARDMGIIDRTNPEQNIFGGAKYLRMLLKRYNGNVSLALAAYNAGMGNVDKAMKIAGSDNSGSVLAALPRVTGHHSKETLGYVSKITKDYSKRTNQTIKETPEVNTPPQTPTVSTAANGSTRTTPVSDSVVDKSNSSSGSESTVKTVPGGNLTKEDLDKRNSEINRMKRAKEDEAVKLNQKQGLDLNQQIASIAQQQLDTLKSIDGNITSILDHLSQSTKGKEEDNVKPKPEKTPITTKETKPAVSMNKKYAS